MSLVKYRDPETGQWVAVGVPKSPTSGEIPISDTPPEDGTWWLDTSEEAELAMYGMKMELLWENASPTNGFDAQTISLDLSSYQGVLVTCVANNGSSYCDIGRSATLVSGVIWSADYSGMDLECRWFNTSQTGVTFSKSFVAEFAANYTRRNTGDFLTKRAVPRRIYGIKGVS